MNPAAAANAPANANAPVCVASTCSGGNSQQAASGSNSNTNTSGGSGPENVTQSIGSLQVGSVAVNPAASANAPVNGNAPVCVASACSGGNSQQAASGPTSSTTTGGGGPQTVTQSILTGQVGSAGVDPVGAVNAPVNGNVPVCVASTCNGGNSQQASSGSDSSSSTSGGGGPQDVANSIVTVQIGSANVNPAATVNAPANANVPVCVASTCNGGDSTQSSAGSSNTSTTTGGGSQDVTHSIGTVQVGTVGVTPAATTNTPANGNAPVCVGSSCNGGSATQAPGPSNTPSSNTAGTAPTSTTTSTSGPSSGPSSPVRTPQTSSPTPKATPPATTSKPTTTKTSTGGTTQHKPGGSVATGNPKASHSLSGTSRLVVSKNPTIVKGTLPFTGFPLTFFLLLALALGALGVAVRVGGKEVSVS